MAEGLRSETSLLQEQVRTLQMERDELATNQEILQGLINARDKAEEHEAKMSSMQEGSPEAQAVAFTYQPLTKGEQALQYSTWEVRQLHGEQCFKVAEKLVADIAAVLPLAKAEVIPGEKSALLQALMSNTMNMVNLMTEEANLQFMTIVINRTLSVGYEAMEQQVKSIMESIYFTDR